MATNTYWSTSTMKLDGQAEWIIRVGEKVMDTMRVIGGLPESSIQGYMVIKTPDLISQAHIMNNYPEDLPKTGLQAMDIRWLD